MAYDLTSAANNDIIKTYNDKTSEESMIYVLGSINMDMVAKVPYIPVSGETMTAEKFFLSPGGKGANQAVAVAKLGGKVRFIGKVGCDANGQALLDNLAAANVDADSVGRSAFPTGIAMILVEKGDNRIILSPGANYDFDECDVEEALAEATPGDYLIMQLEIPMETVVFAAELAKKKKMTVVLNPAPAAALPERLTCNVDIICPNESETEILTGIKIKDDVSLAAAVSAFYRMGAKSVVITMGGKGAWVADGSTITHIPPRKVKVVDTTGAGDTFIGAMTLRLEKGEDMVTAGRFAAAASSVTITREGAAASIPSLEEVEKILSQKC